MPQASKIFRIFVSSTFSDMKVERNALQEYVFPRLRELCMQHGTRFQAIDLRWGVSEEASLDQQTMKICLEEIARCQRVTPRPNFIVLLGDRYGWQPLPEEIPAAEFEAIQERVSPQERALLCWEKQDAEGRRGWYRRDDNAVPPVYVLQPREGEFEDYSTWHTKVERPLLQVLRRAVAGLDLSPESRLHYEASATHQEIERGAMQVEDADEHVFGFFRSITNLDEVKDDLPGAPAKDYVDTGADDLFDADAYRRLQDLKGQLGEQIGHNIHEYAARWSDEGITTDHIGRLPEEMAACRVMLTEEYVPHNLCEAVWRGLALVILAECEEMEEKGALELEVKAHEEFGQERARFFVGREAMLEDIETYLAGGSQHPLAVWGESGTGKSALMAKAIEDAEERHRQAEVIYRFIGATPDSSNGRALLESLCRQVSEAYGADASDLPLEYRDLVSEFPKRLALASSNKSLVLFLDALDQLSDADNARSLIWLPRQLPEYVKVVVSTLPGECLDALRVKLPETQRLELEPLSSEEGADLLDRWQASVGRTLQPGQRSEVLHEFNRCSLPLYLKLAFKEARRWRSYDGVPDLGSDIPGIIQNLFHRLSDEPNHGEMLVSRSLGYLAAAKNGLTEDELLDVLSADGEVMDDFYRRSPQSPDVSRLPVVVWSRLYHDLEPYLTERAADGTSLLSFYHRQLRQMVQCEFLEGGGQGNRHLGLAEHFSRQPLWVEREDQGIPNLRKLSELPYQQTRGELWEELYRTLTDFEFVEAKCCLQRGPVLSEGETRALLLSRGVHDLRSDYTFAVDKWPQDRRSSESTILCNLCDFFTRNAVLLTRNPTAVASQLSCDFAGVSETFDNLIQDWSSILGERECCFLRRNNTSQPFRNLPTPLSLPYGNRTFAVEYAQTLNAHVFASHEGDLALLDIETGLCHNWRNLDSDLLWSIGLDAHGNLYGLCEGDNPLRVFELPRLSFKRTISVLVEQPRWIAIRRESNQLAIGGLNAAQIVDLSTEESRVIPYPERKALQLNYGSNMLLFSGSGRFLAVACRSGDVLIYDMAKGKFLEVKGYCGDGALSLTFDSSERTLYAGSGDGQILEWDIYTHAMNFRVTRKGGVESLLWLERDALLLSGHRSGEICVWSHDEDRPVTTLDLGAGYVLALASLPAGDGILACRGNVTLLPNTLECLSEVCSGEINALSACISDVHRTLLVAERAVSGFDTTGKGLLFQIPISQMVGIHNIPRTVDGLAWMSWREELPPWARKMNVVPLRVACGSQGDRFFVGCSDGAVFAYALPSPAGLTADVFTKDRSPVTNITCSDDASKVVFLSADTVLGFEVDAEGNILSERVETLSNKPKDFSLVTFVHDDRFLLMDVGKATVISAGSAEAGDSLLQIRRFMDFSVLSECWTECLLVCSAYCRTTGWLYLGEGDETLVRTPHSKLTGHWDFNYSKITHVKGGQYGIYRIRARAEDQSLKFLGQLEKICEGHRWPLVGMAVMAQGSLLATSGADGSIRLWSTKNGRLLSEVCLKGKTLCGPHPKTQDKMLCVDNGPGNPVSPEIYSMRVENLPHTMGRRK